MFDDVAGSCYVRLGRALEVYPELYRMSRGELRQALADELSDLRCIESEVAEVYCHVTGGAISKVMTEASAVIGEADAVAAKDAEAAVADASGELMKIAHDLQVRLLTSIEVAQEWMDEYTGFRHEVHRRQNEWSDQNEILRNKIERLENELLEVHELREAADDVNELMAGWDIREVDHTRALKKLRESFGDTEQRLRVLEPMRRLAALVAGFLDFSQLGDHPDNNPQNLWAHIDLLSLALAAVYRIEPPK